MDAYYVSLGQESLLHISGPDSLKFLQGQTTCDTSQIDENRALLGAYCNPQGRMVCDFLLTRLGEDHYTLRMRRDIIDQATSTLAKYIIFSKAELDSNNTDWQAFACWGKEARRVLGNIFPALPEQALGVATGDNFVVVQIDQAGTQFECFTNNAAQPQPLEELAGAIPQGSESSWQALQIAGGIGRIESATVEQFIPQMLNFDVTGHVSFTKGCYTGQEVVARMHYRGKPKRRLYIAAVPSGELPVAGTALFTPDSTQSVGNIVNSAQGADGVVVALLAATTGGIDNGLHIGSHDGAGVTIGALPYSLEKS